MQSRGQQVFAVGARDQARAREFADAFEAPRAYGDYRSVIDDPEVEAIYIALTNDRHLEWTVAALEAGKHVLCEKPLAMNGAEVEQMANAAARTGKLLLEAFAYRFNPQVSRVREIVDSGVLGRVVSVHVSFCVTMQPDDFRWEASLGGGATYDVGCYCIDLLRLVARSEPVRVAAFRTMRGEVDATTGGLLMFETGALGHFTGSFVGTRSQHLAVTGMEGTLSLDWPYAPSGPPPTLRLNGEPEGFQPNDPYAEMVGHFAAAVRGEVPLRYTPAGSLAQARVLDAVFAASRTGQAVDVER